MLLKTGGIMITGSQTLSRHLKTYFRLFSEEESFDTLEKPDVDAEDRNVVNAGNSTPYWFNAYTSSSGRNVDFEKHGWDEDSITLVRLLMAGDWLELYGIQDFGGVTGAPLTDAQLAQLISNTRNGKIYVQIEKPSYMQPNHFRRMWQNDLIPNMYMEQIMDHLKQ